MHGPTYDIPCFYLAIFFQGELRIADERDIRVSFAGLTWDRASVESRSTPRR